MILLINDSPSWKVEIDVRMADDLDDICDELSWQDRISCLLYTSDAADE